MFFYRSVASTLLTLSVYVNEPKKYDFCFSFDFVQATSRFYHFMYYFYVLHRFFIPISSTFGGGSYSAEGAQQCMISLVYSPLLRWQGNIHAPSSPLQSAAASHEKECSKCPGFINLFVRQTLFMKYDLLKQKVINYGIHGFITVSFVQITVN